MVSNTESALITGASLGIGREIAGEFVELMRGFGCRVLL
jgi:NAD(P)-dependent dehydrogenase (short-subunit alcohol dehydrogenase family)